jgi:hypothetical protein
VLLSGAKGTSGFECLAREAQGGRSIVSVNAIISPDDWHSNERPSHRSGTPEFSRNLGSSDTGADVRRLQELLVAEGHLDSSSVTGYVRIFKLALYVRS